MFKYRNSLFIIVSSVVFVSSCKKENNDLGAEPPANSGASAPAATPSIAQLNNTAFLKTQEFYLWSEQLPTAYNGAELADPAAVMTDIRRYSNEAGFSGPVDRWSFAMKKTEWDAYSGGMSSLSDNAASAGDFGISVFFRAEGDLRVKIAEPNSPAGNAGIRRGWRILSINSNLNITTANSQFIIDNVYKSNTTSFSFQKPDGTILNVSLNAAHYTLKPLFLDTVYNTPVGKAGYMVYNSFLGDINQSISDYNRVFNRFAQAGINELIVDLRYNGGGYVDLQEKLANYIINNSANGAVMMNQIYNASHSSENTTTRFQKSGSLNLNRVYFIVSSSTASASELLINNLRPYMDVRLIGPSKTHGKPVGFFPIENGDWYVFPVSFRTTNKNNEGNYYSGFSPNALVADGLDKDWGNTTETALASALRNISSGSYRGTSETPYVEVQQISGGNALLEKQSVKILVDRKN